MGVRATELRKGMVLEEQGKLLLITEYSHHTPGNLRAIIHIKTRDLRSGSTGQQRLGSSDVLEVAHLEKKNCEYLYREASGEYVFMDQESFEQFNMPAELIEDKMNYVKENTVVMVTFHDGLAIGLELPAAVVLKVTESEHAVKGNTATNVKKEVTVETGLKVKVPIHIQTGELIKIRCEDAEFLGRA
ncbi:MAG: elongation factor P [Planctomycetes bacterium]|nr:elongation factor P [Planctomycetota bacterium]